MKEIKKKDAEDFDQLSDQERENARKNAQSFSELNKEKTEKTDLIADAKKKMKDDPDLKLIRQKLTTRDLDPQTLKFKPEKKKNEKR